MREKKIERYDVVIIGGGPAGLSAAFYTGGLRLNTLLIEQSLIGGLAVNTNKIGNYLGFPEGITGKGLMDLFYQQAKKSNVKFKRTDVKKVILSKETKKVETFDHIYEAKVVVIATGGRPKTTRAKNEDSFLGKGISFCTICDAAANTGKTVVVIGSGDAAIEEGLFLTKFAEKVVISIQHERDCSEIAKALVLENPKIECQWNTIVDYFEGDDQLRRIILINLKTGKVMPIDCQTCFEFLGYTPNTEIFNGIIHMTNKGYILTNEYMETNIPGVFAVGDVREKFLRQVVTCASDGAIAGVSAEKYISQNEAFKNKTMKDNKPSITYVYSSVEVNQRKLLEEIKKIELEYKGQYYFYKIDIYKSKSLIHKLGVKNCPAIIINKDGVEKHIYKDISKEIILKALK